jgi:hypothetical protein
MSEFTLEAHPPKGLHAGVGGGALAAKVVDCAKHWEGRQFHAGEKERCAAFVRQVFKDTGLTMPVVSKPTDYALLPPGAGVGENHADSFAGDEVGERIMTSKIAPGDIVMYKNTYGNFRPGVLTHIAIYVGDDRIIHRPTVAKPVVRERLHYATIGEIRRPKQYGSVGGGQHSGSVKLFKHDGRISAFRDGQRVSGLDIRIACHGKMQVWVNGRSVDPSLVQVQMFV